MLCRWTSFFYLQPVFQILKSPAPDPPRSSLFISGATACISSASLKEDIIISLKGLFFNLKAVSSANGVQSPPKIASLPPSIFHAAWTEVTKVAETRPLPSKYPQGSKVESRISPNCLRNTHSKCRECSEEERLSPEGMTWGAAMRGVLRSWP